MRHLKTLASALAIVLLILMATDYLAMAATGKPLILGKVNKSGKTTTIKSAKGAALSLKTKSTQPPLKVNSHKVVNNLNVDKLDGKSARQLGVRVRADRINLSGSATTEVTQVFSGLTKGTYRVDYDLWLDRNNPSDAYCFIQTSDGDYGGYASSPSGNGNAVVLSGVGIIRFSANESATLFCRNASPANVSTFDGSYMMFTPVDSQSGATLPRKADQGRLEATGPGK